MGRPKKSTVANRKNGGLSTKKQARTRVATLDLSAAWYDAELWDDEKPVEVRFRPRTKKGYAWDDEVHWLTVCLLKRKRVHFESPPPEPTDEIAA